MAVHASPKLGFWVVGGGDGFWCGGGGGVLGLKGARGFRVQDFGV